MLVVVAVQPMTVEQVVLADPEAVVLAVTAQAEQPQPMVQTVKPAAAAAKIRVVEVASQDLVVMALCTSQFQLPVIQAHTQAPT
jgi:hypothetical protein